MSVASMVESIEILRSCPGLSAKVMNERLRKMTRFTIVQRTVLGEKPPVQVEYALTPFGRRFIRILEEVHALQEAVDNEESAVFDRTHGPEERRSRSTTACSRRPPRGRG